MAQYLDALELFEKNCMTEYLAIKVKIIRAAFTFKLISDSEPLHPLKKVWHMQLKPKIIK